jgi:hypothetical protein
MSLGSIVLSTLTVCIASILLSAGVALGAEIKLMSSAGFAAAYLSLPPEFEAATNNTVANAWGPSMGTPPVHSAGIAVGAKEPDADAALIRFLASPAAATAIIKGGMEPATSAK